MNTLAGGLHPQSRVDHFVSKGWWTSETIDGLFWQRVAERPDALAVVDPLNRPDLDGEEPRRLTWGELGSEVAWLASEMLQHGIGQGDVIGMQLPTVSSSSRCTSRPGQSGPLSRRSPCSTASSR